MHLYNNKMYIFMSELITHTSRFGASDHLPHQRVDFSVTIRIMS